MSFLGGLLVSYGIGGARPVHLGKSSGSRCYLNVFDLPHHSAADSRGMPARDTENIENTLQRLEPHHANVIRVFVDESDETYEYVAKPEHYPPKISAHSTGFCSIASQWRQNAQDEWFVLRACDFVTSDDASNVWEMENSTSLRNTYLSIRERLHNPDKKFAQVMRRMIMREEGGYLTVFVLCKTILQKYQPGRGGNADPGPFFLTENFVKELIRLDHIYRLIRTYVNRKQLFLLHYLHANLNLFAKFLERFINSYVETRRRDFDPRSSKLRRWVLEEMARDSQHYRQLTSIGNELSDMLESMVDIVKAIPDSEEDHSTREAVFLNLEQELRGCCRDVRGRLSRLTDDMESSLKFLDLTRNFHQTSDVQLLTILATLFLPLSLASGVLSMQTRFKDLGVLLYDFFGVVFLVLTILIIILVSMVLWGFFQEQATKYLTEKLLKPVWRILGFSTGLAVLVLGALVLASFLVGMFKDVTLGAHILGYGFAVAFGLPVAVGLLAGACSVVFEISRSIWESIRDIVASWKNGSRKRTENDVEGDAVRQSEPSSKSVPVPAHGPENELEHESNMK